MKQHPGSGDVRFFEANWNKVGSVKSMTLVMVFINTSQQHIAEAKARHSSNKTKWLRQIQKEEQDTTPQTLNLSLQQNKQYKYFMIKAKALTQTQSISQ